MVGVLDLSLGALGFFREPCRQGRMDRTGFFGQRTFPLLSPFYVDGLEIHIFGRCDFWAHGRKPNF